MKILLIVPEYPPYSIGGGGVVYEALAKTYRKMGHKVVVILNFSKQAQKFTIKDASISGDPMNIFMGVKEKVNDTHEFSIEPWGYIVYDYQ